ncbi:MAG: hypothetical protein MJ180_02000 [Candidatus Gastranaerophilales bacterium]|nr:hypothetical protein [Candidatus Gastranaerophilales bacterium]
MTFLNPNYKEENEKTAEEKFIFFKKLSNKEITEETNAALTENKKDEPVVQTQEKVTTVKNNIKQDPLTKSIVNEVTTEIAEERSKMLEELSLLWVSAVQKSDTVYFAIMKLSNPNGEEVNKSGVKKILAPIISAAPLVGQAFVNPALSAGSLIGSNLMGTMINDTANSRLTKVNDADLVILARSIDELQETLLLNYLAYKSALKEYELSIKITDSRKEIYDKLNAENSPHVILANTFYTEALDNQYKARQEFLMKRVVLEQMVGTDALNEMEKKTVSLAE